MPAFKPKFAVPSSQKSEVLHSKQVSRNVEVAVSMTAAVNLQTLTQVNWKSNIKPDEPTRSLTDEQYDDIFDSVLKKAASGALLDVELSHSMQTFNSSDAAQQFNIRTQNISPTNVKATNEITPNTSPLDDTSNSVKLLMKRPVKKKPKSEKRKDTISRKRKTLDYLPEQTNSGSLPKSHQKEKRRKSDSELIAHRKKVLNKGVWVQCDDIECLKWRYLQCCSDPSTLPERWTCSMNKDDPTQNKCSDPEIDWTSCVDKSDDHFVFTDYNAGSIVWAKMPGYPAWPAMVDSDPDYDLFYDYDHNGKVLRYHVVFLDDHVSRAWIPTRSIEPYSKNSYRKFAHYKARDFKSDLESAIERAEKAITLSLEERLEKYNFEKRYLTGGKRKEWTSKRSIVRAHVRREKDSSHGRKKAEMEAQVVPSVASSSEDNPSPLAREDEDYCVKAEDLPKSGTSPNTVAEKKTKTRKAKPKTTDDHILKTKKSNHNTSNGAEKPKVPIKPTFKAPRRKPDPPRASKPPPNAVASSPPQKSRDYDKIAKQIPANQMTFDPDIYTMELSEQPKRGESKNEIEVKEMIKGDVSLPELQFNSPDDKENTSPELNKDEFGKDFWEVEDDKKEKDDDPFCDIDVDAMEESKWEDEEKIKELDELMPVITEHF